jgi:hypothetical protein
MVKPIGVLECPTVSMLKATALEQRAEMPKPEDDWVVVGFERPQSS